MNFCEKFFDLDNTHFFYEECYEESDEKAKKKKKKEIDVMGTLSKQRERRNDTR